MPTPSGGGSSLKFTNDKNICSFKANGRALKNGNFRMLIHEKSGYPEPLMEWVRETNTGEINRGRYPIGYKRDLLLVHNNSNETILLGAMIVSFEFSNTSDAIELEIMYNKTSGAPIIHESNIIEKLEDMISILSDRGVEIIINEHSPFSTITTREITPNKSISIGDSSIYKYSIDNNSRYHDNHDTTNDMDVIDRGLSDVMMNYLEEYIDKKNKETLCVEC